MLGAVIQCPTELQVPVYLLVWVFFQGLLWAEAGRSLWMYVRLAVSLAMSIELNLQSLNPECG